MNIFTKKLLNKSSKALICCGFCDIILYMMMTNTNENTNEKLQIENMLLKQLVEQLQSEIQTFKELMKLATHKRYGISSEKYLNPTQISMFSGEEITIEEKLPITEPVMQEVTYKRRKRKGHSKEQFEGLPIETIEYRLPLEEQVCECCSGQLHEMSKEVRKELVIVKPELKVVEHVKILYSCRNCEATGITVPIKSAFAPKPALPGSPASASAIAYVMSQKFVESMPLYRLEKHLERMGIELSRQTMSNWLINVSERWLKLLYDHMKKELIKLKIIHCDETTIQVLREPGKSAESKSYMWLYRSGRYDPPIVLYDYQPTRSGECPKKFLQEFSGHAHVDAYKGYNKVENTRLSACWSHARRAFSDAIKSLPKNVKPETQSFVISQKGLEYCNSLFNVERILKSETPEVRFIERIKQSKPILDDFKNWLNYYLERTLPQSPVGKAVRYCINAWDKLFVFMENGMLEIDNNRALSSSFYYPHVFARVA